MAKDSLGERSRRLEQEFFLEHDRKLVEELRRMKKLRESKEALAQSSGIRDDAVLTRLVELEIHPETVAALSVVPLVEVAWADGEIDDREKKAILAGAEKLGFRPGGVEHTLLEQWVTHRPDPKLLSAWTHLVEGLAGQMTATEFEALKRDLLGHAREVAEAAGGFLGLGKVSNAEAEMLRTLEAAFRA
jgi:hypothetical protein